MTKKFITSKGSIELVNDLLFIKISKHYFFETGFARIAGGLIPLILLATVFWVNDDPFKIFIRTTLYLIWTIDRLPTLYRNVFKTSFSKRIPLTNILSADIKEDPNELEVHVLLNLRNNRVRTITFRKLEKEYEAFLSNLPVPTTIVSIA